VPAATPEIGPAGTDGLLAGMGKACAGKIGGAGFLIREKGLPGRLSGLLIISPFERTSQVNGGECLEVAVDFP